MIILSNTQPHGGGGSSSIHPKKMDVGAISFGNNQDPAVMKEAARVGGVDGNVSTIFNTNVNAYIAFSYSIISLPLLFFNITLISSFFYLSQHT